MACISACSVLGQNIKFHLGQMKHRSASGDGPLCALHCARFSFIWCCPTLWTRENELNWLNNRDFPLYTLRFALLIAARMSHSMIFEQAITQPIVLDDPWHHIDHLCISALTWARQRAFATATWCARLRARSTRSFNILTAREPVGLSSRRQLILLASHRTALTRERKTSLRIAREIETRISQFLLGWSPRWSRSITWGFEFSAAQSFDLDDRFTFMKHLVERKSHFPCGMLYLRLAQKQVQIWGRRFSSILGFRSPNFAQRNTLVYWNRINRHFGFWEKKYREMEFWPLGNESSPFCRTEWFHMHIKTAFFHLSVWLSWLFGQSGRKFCLRPKFNSWQLAA